MTEQQTANPSPLSDAQIDAVTIGAPDGHAGQIEISEYDLEWPRQFEVQAARIRAALGPVALAVDHTGSTSVPGLAAKPIIDITLTVPDSAHEAAYVPALEAAGYALRIREPDWFEHRMFKGVAPAVNLHVFSAGCTEIARNKLFRDWLRHDAGDLALYAQTKRDLARRDWAKVQNYADAKSDVIGQIMARALRWAGGGHG